MRVRAICSLGAVAGIVACGSGTSSNSAGPGGATSSSGAGGAVPSGTTSTSGSTSTTTTSSGGASTSGTGGSTTASLCKRGIATNTVPGAAFSPSVAWYYDWSLTSAGADVGVQFVPMVWGSTSLGKATPAGSAFLLGFNEPNFHAQSNLTPQQAAADWPMVEAQASATGAAIVSPAMNFCGPASDCNGTDPYQYLKDFFTACPSCKVDYVAVHWYNCDLPSLQDSDILTGCPGRLTEAEPLPKALTHR